MRGFKLQQKSHICPLILVLFLTTCYSIYSQVYPDLFEKTGGDTIPFPAAEQPPGNFIIDAKSSNNNSSDSVFISYEMVYEHGKSNYKLWS